MCCCLIMHKLPSCHHLHLADVCCIEYHLASALWVLTAQPLIISSAPYVAISVSVVFASCFRPQTVDVENSLYFTETCGSCA